MVIPNEKVTDSRIGKGGNGFIFTICYEKWAYESNNIQNLVCVSVCACMCVKSSTQWFIMHCLYILDCLLTKWINVHSSLKQKNICQVAKPKQKAVENSYT